jgi:hypothetical protein
MPNTPPCHQPGAKPNSCYQAMFEWTVHGVGPLYGPWSGWRLAGRNLVTPDGLRLSPERVRGLAFRQDAEARLAAVRARRARQEPQLVRVVVVTLSEFRAHRHGAA